MKTLIIYSSRSGTTKKYATWLHESFPEFDITDIDKYESQEAKKYKRVIVFSQTESATIVAKEFLEENWKDLADKDFYLVTVGVFAQKHWDSRIAYLQLPQEIRSAVKGYTKLPGRLNEEELSDGERRSLKFFGAKFHPEVTKQDLEQVIKYFKGDADSLSVESEKGKKGTSIIVESVFGVIFTTIFLLLFNRFYKELSFLTVDFEQLLPLYNLSLIVGIVANALRIFIHSHWFKFLTDVISGVFFVYLAYLLWTIYPFDPGALGNADHWDVVIRFLLIIPPIAYVIGVTVSFFKGFSGE